MHTSHEDTSLVVPRLATPTHGNNGSNPHMHDSGTDTRTQPIASGPDWYNNLVANAAKASESLSSPDP